MFFVVSFLEISADLLLSFKNMLLYKISILV